MNRLSEVSETAIITMRARAVETQMPHPVINDDKAVIGVKKIRELLPADTCHRLLDRRFPRTLTMSLALRGRKFDTCTKAFLAKNPGALVVSLGCGLDTRYWRVSDSDWRYVEVDLPPVVEYKHALFRGLIVYEIIPGSVLEDDWLDKILSIQKSKVLFLAEGLFMYFNKDQVITLLQKLADKFSESEIVMEVVNEKYTKGIYKKMVEKKIKRVLKTNVGSSYNYGIRDGKDIESYSPKIKLLEEWSFLDEPDVKPSFLKFFRRSKMMSRVQWTVHARIN